MGYDRWGNVVLKLCSHFRENVNRSEVYLCFYHSRPTARHITSVRLGDQQASQQCSYWYFRLVVPRVSLQANEHGKHQTAAGAGLDGEWRNLFR